MSGLSTYEDPLKIEMPGTSFSQGDIFDVNVDVGAMTVMADETIVIYVDARPSGAVLLKQYFDENRVDYGTEYKNLGQNSVEVISTVQPISINLADYVSLDSIAPGSHTLRIEFSRGDAWAEEGFVVG